MAEAKKKPVGSQPKKTEKGGKPTAPQKKVAIVGFAGGRENAPYDKPDEFEIWSCNEAHMNADIKRIDVLFELHDLEWIKEGKRWKEHYPWLCANKKIPVIMQQHFPDIPMSRPYPIAEIVKRWGRYFTNTIAEQIAFAMLAGVKDIHLYGVNMATDIEYMSQRPSVEYWVGLARGMGINVYVPPESDLLKNFYIYGLEDGQLSIMSTRLETIKTDHQKRVQNLQGQIQGNMAALNQSVGAVNMLEYIDRAFIFPNGNFPLPKEMEKKGDQGVK